MKKTLEIGLFAPLMIAIAAALSPVEAIAAEIEGDAGGDNHYILECGGHCYNNLVPAAIGPGYTGAWFDPAQSGHGLFIEVLPDSKIQAAWFTFNPAGTEQAWFVGMGTYVGNSATISMTQPTGGRWIPNFDPHQVVNNAWGTLTLTFSDADHGNVGFNSSAGYGAGSMKMVRLTNPSAVSRWTLAANLNVARSGHTATLLPNGRVLAVGGARMGDASAESYDPATDQWTATSGENGGRFNHTATLLPNGKVLVVGGFNVVDDCKSFEPAAEIYDPAANSWTPASKAISPQAENTATLLPDGRVLVIGGDSCLASEITAQFYDPVSDSWTRAKPPQNTQYDHTATLLGDGRVLLSADYGHSELYDPSTGNWIAQRDYSSLQYGPQSATKLTDGKVLLTGGWQGQVPVRVSKVFNPETTTWTSVEDTKVAHAGGTATSIAGGNVLVLGGVQDYRGSVWINASGAELYDAGMGHWLDAGNLNTARQNHTATLLQDGRVLVAGGLKWKAPDDDSSSLMQTLSSAELYAAPTSIAITSSLTGSWYDPAQSGHGLFVEVLPENRFLAAWFTFNPAGTAQAWLLGVGTYNGNTATIADTFQPSGGRWIPNFDPTRIVNNPWGTLKFTFTDCDHGKVEFASISAYGAGSMNLTRLTQPSGHACS